MGRAYLWALPDEERAMLLRDIKEHTGPNWPKVRDGIERAGECVAKHGFAMSTGEWHSDIHAVGVALKLNDGTGPYAFNCGAPAFKFSEVLLRNDIGPRLVAMVRNIEVAMTGSVGRGTLGKEPVAKKSKTNGGKVARIAEGIR
jgi:DNA-binding IclR family transcriptional regulator